MIHVASVAPLLEARALSLWRGEHLLADAVDVVIHPASIVQIQGTNGSGKTSLLRALIGLAEYDEGEVYWCGQPTHRVSREMHEALIYLGHKPGVKGALTPFENLCALCSEVASVAGGESVARENVAGVLAELGVADRMDLPTAALSAGQQRRVSLARLRLQPARLWVLDEPLTSLDTHGVGWVKNEITQHVARGGAVVFTTHQPLSFDAVTVQTVVLGESA